MVQQRDWMYAPARWRDAVVVRGLWRSRGRRTLAYLDCIGEVLALSMILWMLLKDSKQLRGAVASLLVVRVQVGIVLTAMKVMSLSRLALLICSSVSQLSIMVLLGCTLIELPMALIVCGVVALLNGVCLASCCRRRSREPRLSATASEAEVPPLSKTFKFGHADCPVHRSCEEEEPVCSICMIEYVADDVVEQLPCAHCFHEWCISRWLLEGTVGCPMRCNSPMPPSRPAAAWHERQHQTLPSEQGHQQPHPDAAPVCCWRCNCQHAGSCCLKRARPFHWPAAHAVVPQ